MEEEKREYREEVDQERHYSLNCYSFVLEAKWAQGFSRADSETAKAEVEC